MSLKDTTKSLDMGRDVGISRQIQKALSDIETILALAAKNQSFTEKNRDTIKTKLGFIAGAVRVYVDQEKASLTTAEKADFQLLLNNVKRLASEVVIATETRPLIAKVQALAVEIGDLF